MSIRLVPKSVTLNGVMAVTLRYFSEFDKPALQKTICGGIYARVYCILSACTMSSQRKFTFAISSPDEFLVLKCNMNIRCNVLSYTCHTATKLQRYQIVTWKLYSRSFFIEMLSKRSLSICLFILTGVLLLLSLWSFK